MKVGGIRLLIVPPAAGYGATAHPPIPANSVLIFEVQLAEIQ
jgi:FKBP-type peptidyl-prolyl cis-trans isomerase